MCCCPAQHPHMKAQISLLYLFMLVYISAPVYRERSESWPEVTARFYFTCHIRSGFLKSCVESSHVCVSETSMKDYTEGIAMSTMAYKGRLFKFSISVLDLTKVWEIDGGG